MKHALSTHRAVVAVSGAVLVAVLALVVITLAGGTGHGPLDAKAAAAAHRAATRGYTDKVTVPLFAPNQPRPSQPRPTQLPPMIKSTGACKTAMDAVRDFQDAHPNGLQLTQPESDQLAKLMVAVGPGSPSAACPDLLAERFRLQEFDPWQTWRAPVTAPAARPAAHAKH